MDYTNIQLKPDTKVVVVGDIHGHSQQFFDILEKIKPNENTLLVSVGDLVDKGFGPEEETKIIRELKRLSDAGIAYVTMANHELKHLRKARIEDVWTDELRWIETWPLSVSFLFPNRNRLTIVHGGVTPHHTWQDLKDNTDLAYVRTVDDKGRYIKLKWKHNDKGDKQLLPEKIGCTWHEHYDGRFGYICAGHDAQKDGIAKFYKYSCNIDTAVYHTGILTAQVFTEHGRGELIQVTGKAARPKL